MGRPSYKSGHLQQEKRASISPEVATTFPLPACGVVDVFTLHVTLVGL
ncbi:MAG: hypothetical protein ABR541_09295 [Candidatus Dormibacteria bacterium]